MSYETSKIKTKCPCTDGTDFFNCSGCNLKPEKFEIARLIKIYFTERQSLLNSFGKTLRGSHPYFFEIVNRYVHNIQHYETKEELEKDINENLRMAFEEWYETL